MQDGQDLLAAPEVIRWITLRGVLIAEGVCLLMAHPLLRGEQASQSSV
jgi:hypothetical protein